MQHFLIHNSGQILGRTENRTNAERWASGASVHMRKVYVVSSERDVDTLPKDVRDRLDLIVALLTTRGRTTYEKLALAHGAFRRLKKVSVHQLLRSLYQSERASYSQEELLRRVPGVSWAGLQTSISTLKRKKYIRSGDEPLHIVKRGNVYVRRES